MTKYLSITPIMKVVSACNLNCSYCSADEYMNDRRSSRMSLETLERSINELARVQPSGQFLWHGGEPLLVGRKFYERVIAIQDELGLRGRFRNTMQSNGVTFNRAWAEFFAAEGISVGFSVDGTPAIHDSLRPNHAGNPSFQFTERAIGSAKDAGLTPGVLAVVTAQSVRYPKEIFQFFYESGFTTMDFKPCYGSPGNDVNLLEFAEFMLEVFDEWVALDDPSVRIRSFEGFIHNLLGSSARSCSQNGRCNDLITIDHDGSVYPCDRFLREEYKYGNINDQPLDTLYEQSEAALRFRSLIAEQRETCSTCAYKVACRSGCTQEREYWSDSYCLSRARMIDHIHNWLVGRGESPAELVGVHPKERG